MTFQEKGLVFQKGDIRNLSNVWCSYVRISLKMHLITVYPGHRGFQQIICSNVARFPNLPIFWKFDAEKNRKRYNIQGTPKESSYEYKPNIKIIFLNNIANCIASYQSKFEKYQKIKKNFCSVRSIQSLFKLIDLEGAFKVPNTRKKEKSIIHSKCWKNRKVEQVVTPNQLWNRKKSKI
jgi:hypothetical protein